MSAGSPSDVSAKLRYDGKLRRITIAKADPIHPSPLPLSWAEFEASIRLQCSIPLANSIVVNYYDQDGDPIQIDSDEELAELAKALHEGTISSLKFEVNSHENASTGADENDFVMIPTPPGSDADSLSISESDDFAPSEPLINQETASVISNPFVDDQESELSSSQVVDSEVVVKERASEEISGSEILNSYVESYNAEPLAEVQGVNNAVPSVEDPARESSDSASDTVENDETNETETPDPEVAANAAPSPPEDGFEAFVGEVQPMIDQLLNKLESRPEYIPRLLERFSSSLETRNWGLTIEVPGAGSTSTRAAASQPTIPEVSPASASQVQWIGVVCDACGARSFSGTRHKCLECADFDLCGSCYGNPQMRMKHSATHPFEAVISPSQIWRGVTCDGCDRVAFTGLRYKCKDCPDYDLCGKCFVKTENNSHRMNHTFECKFPEPNGLAIEVPRDRRVIFPTSTQTATVVPPALHAPQVQWTGVRCDACGAQSFSGTRHKCLKCADYDLCGTCFANFESRVLHPKDHGFETIVSQNQVWRGVTCDGCNRLGFPGLRYKCMDCYDFDLCGRCIVVGEHQIHRRNHTFECMDPELRGLRDFGLSSHPSMPIRDMRNRRRPHSHVHFPTAPVAPRPQTWYGAPTPSTMPVPSARPTPIGDPLPAAMFPKRSISVRDPSTGEAVFSSTTSMPGTFPTASTHAADDSHRWVCDEPGCGKSYVGRSGLRYHREHAHDVSGLLPSRFVPPLRVPSENLGSYARAARRGVPETPPELPSVRFGATEIIPRQVVEDIETGIIPSKNADGDDGMNDPQAKLILMGFENTELNADLLRFYDGNLEKVVSKLMKMGDDKEEEDDNDSDDFFWSA